MAADCSAAGVATRKRRAALLYTGDPQRTDT